MKVRPDRYLLPQKMSCSATKANGAPCTNNATHGDLCGVHNNARIRSAPQPKPPYRQSSVRVMPFYCSGDLYDSDIQKYDCSDRILVGRDAYEAWIADGEPGVPNLVKLTNASGASVTGSIFGFHNDDADVAYISYAMYERLDGDVDHVTIERVRPSQCIRLTLQPFTSEHIDAEDPQIYFRNAFEMYSCVKTNNKLALWVDHPTPHVVYVAVRDTLPYAEDDALCIVGGEIELDLLPPLDAPADPLPQSQPQPPEEESWTSLLPIPSNPEPSAGHLLGGTLSTKSRRELLAEAALRRLQHA